MQKILFLAFIHQFTYRQDLKSNPSTSNASLQDIHQTKTMTRIMLYLPNSGDTTCHSRNNGGGVASNR
ncbi:hypothetical protein [Kaarinaea lacus]